MKQKWAKVLCAATLLISALSAAFGWGFLGAANLPFWVQFLLGFCLNATPILVLAMAIMLLRRRK